MARVDPIERIARDICWSGFTSKDGRTGKTKRGYWESVADAKKEEYRRDARYFCFLLDALPLGTINLMHAQGRLQRNTGATRSDAP